MVCCNSDWDPNAASSFRLFGGGRDSFMGVVIASQGLELQPPHVENVVRQSFVRFVSRFQALFSLASLNV